jgi:cytochrome P450
MKMNENKGNKLEELVEDMGSKRRLAFLDSLLVHHIQNPREFTELDIRDEVDTFMFEGHDTTAAAIQFALMLIGLDPHVQVPAATHTSTLRLTLNPCLHLRLKYTQNWTQSSRTT